MFTDFRLRLRSLFEKQAVDSNFSCRVRLWKQLQMAHSLKACSRVARPLLFGSVAAMLLTLYTSGMAQTPAPASPKASQYVDAALDLMQKHSINTHKIDWASLRSETLLRAAGAESSYDTYDAIRFALKSLNDHHSFLQLNDELAKQDKASHVRRNIAPMQPGGSEKWPPSPFIDRRAPEGRLITVGDVRIAHIIVPLFIGGPGAAMDAYANALQGQIEMLAKQKPQGWIIDLRGNLGGNMWPMLDGIGPLIDISDAVGGFVDVEGKKTTWFIHPYGVGMKKLDGSEELMCRVSERKVGFSEPPVIAVLVDHGTASSGEAVAVAFQGQSRVRFFGRITHGQTTSNDGFPLSDGATLVLATGIEADRTGKEYFSGITPDVVLAKQAELPKTPDSDPMIQAAADWIKGTIQN